MRNLKLYTKKQSAMASSAMWREPERSWLGRFDAVQGVDFQANDHVLVNGRICVVKFLEWIDEEWWVALTNIDWVNDDECGDCFEQHFGMPLAELRKHQIPYHSVPVIRRSWKPAA